MKKIVLTAEEEHAETLACFIDNEVCNAQYDFGPVTMEIVDEHEEKESQNG
jgi:hypothetical protein